MLLRLLYSFSPSLATLYLPLFQPSPRADYGNILRFPACAQPGEQLIYDVGGIAAAEVSHGKAGHYLRRPGGAKVKHSHRKRQEIRVRNETQPLPRARNKRDESRNQDHMGNRE